MVNTILLWTSILLAILFILITFGVVITTITGCISAMATATSAAVESMTRNVRELNEILSKQRRYNEAEAIRTNTTGIKPEKSKNFGISEPDQIAPKISIPKSSGFGLDNSRTQGNQ